jgi:hypothetical protein
LTGKRFYLFQRSCAPRSFAGISPVLERFARHHWVWKGFVSQPGFHPYNIKFQTSSKQS